MLIALALLAVSPPPPHGVVPNVLQPGPHAPCGFTHIDVRGYSWVFNLTGLANSKGDYELTVRGVRYVLNVCRPPVSVCRPPGQPLWGGGPWL